MVKSPAWSVSDPSAHGRIRRQESIAHQELAIRDTRLIGFPKEGSVACQMPFGGEQSQI
jgi:hypothetical protein